MRPIEDKQSIRKIFKAQRSSLTKEDVAIRSQQINQNFIKNLLPQIYPQNSNKIFAIYLSSGNEVNTANLIEYFTANNIKFSYPKIIAKNQALKFILSKENQRFKASDIYPTILEPELGEEVLPDILILPLLAFDRQLHRIGTGGGFFDRTIDCLKKQNHPMVIIGLAYDFQGFDAVISFEKTDQKLDFIVSQTTIFPIESIDSYSNTK